MMEHYNAGLFDNVEGSCQMAHYSSLKISARVDMWQSIQRKKEDVKHDNSPLLHLWFVCQQLSETCPLMKHYSPP